MTLGINQVTLAAMLQDIADRTDGGGGAGKLRIYNGVRPTIPGDTATTLLAELTFSATAFLAVVTVPDVSVTMTADTIAPDTSANATGEATWFRMVDFADDFVLDGSAGDVGTEDLVLTSADIAEFVEVGISSMILNANNFL